MRRRRWPSWPRCARPSPPAQLLAGSTDVGLWVNKQFRDLGDIIYVGDVARAEGDRGARRRPISTSAPAPRSKAPGRALARRLPSLTDVWLRFASPPIRNAGTMGGNVANGSPIGDSPPVLMALDAEIELRRGERVRRMPLPDFYVDYMKNRLEPGEFVQGLAVPLAATAAPGARLQDQQALRLRHLGPVRRLRDRARRRRR